MIPIVKNNSAAALKHERIREYSHCPKDKPRSYRVTNLNSNFILLLFKIFCQYFLVPCQRQGTFSPDFCPESKKNGLSRVDPFHLYINAVFCGIAELVELRGCIPINSLFPLFVSTFCTL